MLSCRSGLLWSVHVPSLHVGPSNQMSLLHCHHRRHRRHRRQSYHQCQAKWDFQKSVPTHPIDATVASRLSSYCAIPSGTFDCPCPRGPTIKAIISLGVSLPLSVSIFLFCLLSIVMFLTISCLQSVYFMLQAATMSGDWCGARDRHILGTMTSTLDDTAAPCVHQQWKTSRRGRQEGPSWLTPEPRILRGGFKKLPKTRMACGRPKQTTFSTSSTTFGIRCEGARHRNGPSLPRPSYPPLPLISNADTHSAASPSMSTRRFQTGSIPVPSGCCRTKRGGARRHALRSEVAHCGHAQQGTGEVRAHRAAP